MSVVVIARIVPEPEHREEIVRHLEHAIARVHAEDAGCELYALNQSPNLLVMIEKWVDQEALGAHGRSPAYHELGAALSGKIIGDVDVIALTPHPAGTETQGAL